MITIREAEKKDVNALATIEREAFSDDMYEEHRFTKKELKAELRDKELMSLVIEDDGVVAGYVVVDISNDDPSAANIDSLAIDPDYSNKGLEPMLLVAAEQAAINAGFDAMTIQEPENADNALKVLHRSGYHKTETLSGYFTSKSAIQDGIELTKILVSQEEKKGKVQPRRANVF